MAIILCIETATEICSVSIAQDGKTISLEEDFSGNSHASQLHILVQKALEKVSLTFNQLDAIAISKGPGSYTGLRVGVSAAKGYCYALQIPLIAINTLQSIANGFILNEQKQNVLLCPMIDARRMEVYCAIYDSKLNEVLPTQAKIIDSTSFDLELNNTEIIFIGNGAQKCKSVLNNKNINFEYTYLCSASYLSSIAQQYFNQKQLIKYID
jgi:tRNA threonylcarbamoyladenosine biosynthesis protein TsaB